jgi:hypothetical protein
MTDLLELAHIASKKRLTIDLYQRASTEKPSAVMYANRLIKGDQGNR